MTTKHTGNVLNTKKFTVPKGRLHVVDDKITKFIEHNNHVPNAAKIEAKKVISTLKKNASQTTLSTHSVLGNAVMQLIHILVTYRNGKIS
ncbi:unnamed protein product [Macrosiphum euphorbiae]|uniref:Uncharacterized protein n=1 Tax=Macrosiphum euphorbiae TaxID=13131 RepID=A0AAV0WB48_9HEMI|nr:unnamed protein product [Macrosiphum euphorbiae]